MYENYSRLIRAVFNKKIIKQNFQVIIILLEKKKVWKFLKKDYFIFLLFDQRKQCGHIQQQQKIRNACYIDNKSSLSPLSFFCNKAWGEGRGKKT